MNLKVSKEKITSAEVICSDTNEQSIELDYILPDYYPEIFRILKCTAEPQITSYIIDNDKLTYEMSVCIRVLYCAENRNSVHIINQKLTYSKKLDIGKACSNSMASICPQITYINCRAVNPRRIDIRGAAAVSVSVTGMNCTEVISDVDGGNVQLKKEFLTYPADRLNVTKQFVVSDKFDVGLSKPSIIDIIRNNAIITSVDKKIISDKLILKGEAQINMLYTCQKDDSDSIELMQFTMPFSQVIDLEGIDDRFDCIIKTDVVSCDTTPCSDGDGNSGVAECVITICVSCSAYKNSSAELVVDEYSTSYATESERTDISIETSPYLVNNICVLKSTVNSSDNEIDCIYDVWCSIKSYSVVSDFEENCLRINGTAVYTVLAKNTENNPVLIEKEEAFTTAIPVENLSAHSKSDIQLTPLSCSYTLSSDNTIEIKSELRTSGCVRNYVIINGITEIIVNEDEPINRNNDYALKIYFTDENEDLWEIAKKYGTSVSAIVEENEIEDDMITGSGMILIPIV